MFEYFTSIGLYGSTTTEDSRSLNYEVEHQLPSGACTNYFIDIAAGSCPGAAGELQQISLIVFRVTLLNPDGMPLPGTQLGVSGTNPAAQIADQVWVTNQVNPQYPCGPAVIEQPAPPTALFQLNDGSPSSPQVFDTVQPLDSASVDGSLSGSTFGQAPGPLACNPSLGALSLNSNVANANFVDSLYFNGQAHGNFVCSTDQHPLPPGCPANPPDSVTLEVWFDPTQNNGGNASYLMSQGPSGIELSLQNNLGGVQVTDGAASSAKVNSSLVVGKWYFFAATITAAGDTDSSSSVISAYLCGATVASGAPGCTSSVANPGTTPGGITNCDLLIGARATNSPPCSTAPPEPQPGQSVPGANCAAGYPTPPGTPGGGCPYGFFQGETADAVVYEGAALNQNQLTTEYLELSQ